MAKASVGEARAPAGRLPEIVSIQHLRALAALSIVVFHALGAARSFPVGGAGVDVFFVISGFIMWSLTEQAERAPGRFLWRRLVRVAPPYWIATFAIAAIWVIRPRFLWMPPFDARQLALSLLFVPHLDGWGRNFPVLTQGWTLNYEMFFYLVFAATLFLPRRRQLLVLTGTFVALAAVGVAIRPQAPAAQTYLNPLLLEFLAGAWLGRAWLAGRLRRPTMGVILLGLGVAAFALENGLGVSDGAWRALLWGGPAAAIIAGALNLEGAGKVLRSRTLKALGDGSYSIYLFHPPIVALFERVLAHAPTPVRLGVTVVACGTAGIVLHRVVERPITAALRRQGRPVRADVGRLISPAKSHAAEARLSSGQG